MIEDGGFVDASNQVNSKGVEDLGSGEAATLNKQLKKPWQDTIGLWLSASEASAE